MADSDFLSMVRIGVDVGGTNTDAVILDPSQTTSAHRGVLAWHKTPTTSPDVTDGIEAAVLSVLDQSKVPTHRVSSLTIGTTHFINAVVEHNTEQLSRVAVIRITKSYTRDIPPFSDFPPALKGIMNGYYGYVDGGLQIDGSQESPINRAQIVQRCGEIRAKGLKSIVINGVFSPIDTHFRQENAVRKIVLEEMPYADVVCASEVANLGFLERENAAILNASILKLARRTIRGFRAAMSRLHLKCPLYLTQNDGTLINAADAARLPIRTFSSGATNSMRGASYLGLSDLTNGAIVVDIGGTTSDVGVLLPSGYPRQASAFTTVAGIRINFNIPHVESIGLGGGSIVDFDSSGKINVGPSSVGYRLTSMSKVFGGTTLTATDIAVAHNPDLDIGNPSFTKDIPLKTVVQSRDCIKAMLERVIDMMKTSPDPLPVLLVGGGSAIAPDNLDGVSELIRPPFHQVANAVGAAISKAGSTVDIIQSTAKQTVAQALEYAKLLAIANAIKAGAQPESIMITEMDSIPLQYVEHQIRTIVRVAGDLSADVAIHEPCADLTELEEESEAIALKSSKPLSNHNGALEVSAISTVHELDSYRPEVVKNEQSGIKEWILSETDLIWLADGCYVLGCAGGGTPRPEFLKLRDQVRDGHKIRMIEATSLKNDASVYWGGNMGSPAVSAERLSGSEMLESIREMMYYLRHDSFDAVMAVEVGGANGLQPLLWGSAKNFNRPVIDADWMGRAYPNYWQTTLTVHESNQLVPCAIASGNGKSLIMTRTDEDLDVDRVLRAPCVEMGSYVGMCGKPTIAEKIVKYGVMNTYSSAWRIGRCINRAKLANTIVTVGEQIIEELGGPSAAKVLFRGKIVGVERRLLKGHSYGEVIIEELTSAEEDGLIQHEPVARGGQLKVPFKNEIIYAQHVAEDGTEKYIAMVPDLIAILDVQTGKALGVPEFRYGVIVQVLGISASPRWTSTPRGLEIGGPGAFGYDLEYKPLGTYAKPRSVIEQFS